MKPTKCTVKAHTHEHTYLHAHVHTHEKHTRQHDKQSKLTHTHTHTHIHTHTHTHTQIYLNCFIPLFAWDNVYTDPQKLLAFYQTVVYTSLNKYKYIDIRTYIHTYKHR